MTSITPGRFFALGVGPGDPDLLPLKAVNILRRVRFIHHAGPEDQRGRAWEIVRPHLPPDAVGRTVMTASMSEVSAADWRVHYRPAVERIIADCRAGRDVAFITEGDPTLYSTAIPVWQLLAEIAPEIPIEIVPGVTSITAAAARAGWPLARKDEPFLIIPASHHAADLARWIADFPSLCLLKPARAMPQLSQTLETFGPARQAVYVEELGTPREFVTSNLANVAERQAYFSLLLVRARSASKCSSLSVVGIGPGDPRLLTEQARNALRDAEIIIGYDVYLKMLAALGLRAELQPSPIGAEADRARQALELAMSGKRVALVSSGDAGVYGMASLLLEHAEKYPDIAVEIIPGVTAATAAAALLGAPLGHDFACISLSDLLTPWETIEARLDAAGRSDFVLAFYNPISQRRTWQLPRAREILLRYRQPDTPVGLVDRAHRPGMRVWQMTLGEWSPDGIGMETVIIVGNSQTRIVNGRMVTPRGYRASQTSGERKFPEEEDQEIRRQGDKERAENSAAEEEKRPVSLSPRLPVSLTWKPSSLARTPGRQILDASFAIIERELGDPGLPAWAYAVVRRMIHASADFDFAKTLRFSDDFESAVRAALAGKVPVVTDTEMVLHGIRAMLHDGGLTVHCHLNDPEVAALAESAGLTRSAAGIRVAARHHAEPLLVIGNAPTALEEAIRLIEEQNWRPAAIVGMPVGFVGVEEAKGRLLEQGKVPYLTCIGRKGGSAVAAAAMNALVEWMRSE